MRDLVLRIEAHGRGRSGLLSTGATCRRARKPDRSGGMDRLRGLRATRMRDPLFRPSSPVQIRFRIQSASSCTSSGSEGFFVALLFKTPVRTALVSISGLVMAAGSTAVEGIEIQDCKPVLPKSRRSPRANWVAIMDLWRNCLAGIDVWRGEFPTTFAPTAS